MRGHVHRFLRAGHDEVELPFAVDQDRLARGIRLHLEPEMSGTGRDGGEQPVLARAPECIADQVVLLVGCASRRQLALRLFGGRLAAPLFGRQHIASGNGHRRDPGGVGVVGTAEELVERGQDRLALVLDEPPSAGLTWRRQEDHSPPEHLELGCDWSAASGAGRSPGRCLQIRVRGR